MEKYTYFRDAEKRLVTKVKPRTPRKGQEKVTREPLQDGGTYKFVNGHLELIEPGPKTEVLHIRPGDHFYKSRDGRKIKVWTMNANSVDKPVVGMIQTGDIWEARYWNDKGITKVPYGPGNDIVVEWSDS